MTLQLSTPVANARLDVIEATIGIGAVLRIRSGAPPADCSAADSGAVLATVNLPSDWMTNAAARQKTKSGTWEDASADNAGTAGHWRVYDSGGTCHMQGTCSGTGGGGDMTIDNPVFAAGQDFLVTAFTWIEG